MSTGGVDIDFTEHVELHPIASCKLLNLFIGTWFLRLPMDKLEGDTIRSAQTEGNV